MKSNLKICRLNKNNWNEFFDIRLLGLQEYPEAFGTSAEEWSKTSKENVQATLNDFLILGAFENELIGTIGFKREQRVQVNHKGTIWGFYVNNQFQNKGIGKLLLERMLEELKHYQNLEYVRCIITETNKSAISVFESSGFKRYGLESKGLKIKNTYFDQLYYQKELL